MEENSYHKPHIIKTPVHKIPIGEAVKKADGHYSIRIKRPQSSEYEELSLDHLISMVVAATDSVQGIVQAPRYEGAAAQKKKL